jgi:hypothetical protein
MGTGEWINLMHVLLTLFPGLRNSIVKIKSKKNKKYNCIAFAADD